LNRNGGSISLFDAFSSREPVSTSLENALAGNLGSRGYSLLPARYQSAPQIQFLKIINRLKVSIDVPTDAAAASRPVALNFFALGRH
jgi:hypothetical protein